MLNFSAVDSVNHFASPSTAHNMQSNGNSFVSTASLAHHPFNSSTHFTANDEKSPWNQDQQQSIATNEDPKNYCATSTATIGNDQTTFLAHKGSENVKRFSVNNLLQLANNCRSDEHRLAGA